MKCKFCDGIGRVFPDNPRSSRFYICTDCGGTGREMLPCDCCGLPTPDSDLVAVGRETVCRDCINERVSKEEGTSGGSNIESK